MNRNVITVKRAGPVIDWIAGENLHAKPAQSLTDAVVGIVDAVSGQGRVTRRVPALSAVLLERGYPRPWLTQHLPSRDYQTIAHHLAVYRDTDGRGGHFVRPGRSAHNRCLLGH
jgi:hypothetical protein